MAKDNDYEEIEEKLTRKSPPGKHAMKVSGRSALNLRRLQTTKRKKK